MQLVLDTRDLRLSRERGSFVVESPKGGIRKIGAKKLTSIAVTARVWIESPAVELAIRNEIPILFFDRIGKAQARLWSPYFQSIATLRRGQVRFGESPAAVAWLTDVLRTKTEGQIRNLRYLANRRPSAREKLLAAAQQLEREDAQFDQYRGRTTAEVRNDLLLLEARIAGRYWPTVGAALPAPYTFSKRSRRPAEDIFNALLNYAYGMSYSIVESALFAAGLDPYLGFLHTDAYRKPTLSFDLIECIRPWVDRFLVTACLDKLPVKSMFTANQHGLFLNKNGKAWLIPAYNDWLREDMRFLNRQTSRRNHVYALAGLLARRIRTAEGLTDSEI